MVSKRTWQAPMDEMTRTKTGSTRIRHDRVMVDRAFDSIRNRPLVVEAGNIDWPQRVISYARKKTGEQAFVRFGSEFERILRSLPESGPLFPYLRTVRASNRATELKQRCEGLNIHGVTLHSYRYAWAERAKTVGFPERFASLCFAPPLRNERWPVRHAPRHSLRHPSRQPLTPLPLLSYARASKLRSDLPGLRKSGRRIPLGIRNY